jgi:hypothetical protein
MLDQTDPVRDLVRRAYHVDDDFDLTAGLLDVARRTEPVPAEIPVQRPVRRPDPRRPRSGLAMVATFAAAILVIVGVAVLAGRGPQQNTEPGGNDPASAAVNGAPGPKVLPTSCAADWKLTLDGKEFAVTGNNPECPPLQLDRLWLLDAARGNGLIMEGDATIWRLSPAGGTTPTVTPPFKFTVEGWPGPAAGHYYEIWYVGAGGPAAHSGDDATTVYEYAYGVSFRLLHP